MSAMQSNTCIEPDQFPSVPANVKILKVLVEELHSAAGSGQELDFTAIDALQDDESGDDEEWEDDPDILDFPGVTKKGKLRFTSPTCYRDICQYYHFQFYVV